MDVKNLHDTDSYRACQALVAAGKYDTSILIPMKWELLFFFKNGKLVDDFIQDLTERFGKPAHIGAWASNYNDPWFHSVWEPLKGARSVWEVCVHLTTDDQLTFMQLAYAHLERV